MTNNQYEACWEHSMRSCDYCRENECPYKICDEHVYLLVKEDYEGCTLGDKVYLSKDVAEIDFDMYQHDPNSRYYNHPNSDVKWEIREFDFNYREIN